MCITETQHYSVCNTLGQISWELLNFLKKSSWTRLVAKTHMFDSKRLIVNWIYGLKSSGLRSKVIYPKYSKHWPYLLAYTLHCDCSKILNNGLNQRENTIRDSLQKFITLHKARLVGGWRLVQNACRNWAIAPGVTQRGPKYAQEP